MSEAVQWQGEHIMKLATEANTDAMKKATLFLEGEVKQVFGTGASRIDVAKKRRSKGKRGTFHRPSAPDFPPNVDTGTLRASITGVTEVMGLEIQGFVGSDLEKIAAKSDVGTDLEYGYYLEIGTTKMDARPFLRPTLKANGKKILEFFKKANK